MITTASSSPPVSGWLTLAEAKLRSGRSTGHLARQCRADWLSRGLARQAKQAKGKPTWQIHETADPALAPVKFPEQLPADLGRYTQAARDVALDRKRLLDRWGEAVQAAFTLGFNRDAATGQFLQRLYIDEGKEIGRATLYNWERRWRAEGLVGLIDGRQKSAVASAPATVDPFMDEVKRLYLTVRQLKLTICHQIASLKAAEAGWEIRHYKTCQRAIDAIPKAVVLKMRFGEEAFNNKGDGYIERDYSTLASNEIWCGDHHQFDVIVSAGGKLARPWLTAWQDLRSRKIVGWEIRAADPNTDAVLSAFRRGVMDAGVPTAVYIDNGKDFDSYALQGRTKKDRWAKRGGKFAIDQDRAGGIFASLGVTPQFAWAYHGQSKPIERFFGTVEQQTPVWATYCGNSTANKPEDLQLQLERGKAPPLADFVAWFADWLAAGYHDAAHSGDAMNGRTPAAVFAECLAVKRTASKDLLDVLLLPTTKPLRVGRNGVTWQGLRYGQHEPALHPLLGKQVVLRIEDRIGSVQVWTTDGKFVCVAASNQKVPVNATQQQKREAIASRRADSKLRKQYFESRPRMSEDLPDRLIRAAAAANTAERPDSSLPPPSIQPVRSPLESQLPELRRAFETAELRPAVGAEGGGFGGGFVCPSMPTPASEDDSYDAPFTFQPSRDAGEIGDEP